MADDDWSYLPADEDGAHYIYRQRHAGHDCPKCGEDRLVWRTQTKGRDENNCSVCSHTWRPGEPWTRR